MQARERRAALRLLEEFLDVAPELAQLSDGVEAQFWATVSLLAHSWECLLDHIDARDNKVRSDVVRGLSDARKYSLRDQRPGRSAAC